MSDLKILNGRAARPLVTDAVLFFELSTGKRMRSVEPFAFGLTAGLIQPFKSGIRPMTNYAAQCWYRAFVMEMHLAGKPDLERLSRVFAGKLASILIMQRSLEAYAALPSKLAFYGFPEPAEIIAKETRNAESD